MSVSPFTRASAGENPLNKRKKVAWHKHLKKARKQDEKRHAQTTGATRPVGVGSTPRR